MSAIELIRTEAKFTQTDYLKPLRSAHPSWVVLKHCDNFTKGIPDVSASLGFRTVWVEIKRLKKRTHSLTYPYLYVDALQAEITTRLHGLYLVRDEFNDQTAIAWAGRVRDAALSKSSLLSDHRFMMWKGTAFKQLDRCLTLLLEENQDDVNLREL